MRIAYISGSLREIPRENIGSIPGPGPRKKEYDSTGLERTSFFWNTLYILGLINQVGHPR